MLIWSTLYIQNDTRLFQHFLGEETGHKSVPKDFGTSAGFQTAASAFAPQCYIIWAMKTHTLEAGHFIEFINPWKEWDIEWNCNYLNCDTAGMASSSFRLYFCSSQVISFQSVNYRSTHQLHIQHSSKGHRISHFLHQRRIRSCIRFHHQPLHISQTAGSTCRT